MADLMILELPRLLLKLDTRHPAQLHRGAFLHDRELLPDVFRVAIAQAFDGVKAPRSEFLAGADCDTPDFRRRHRLHDSVQLLRRVLPQVHSVVAARVLLLSDGGELRKRFRATD